MIWDYFEKRESLVLVFVLIDSRIDPQNIDLEFISSLGEKGIPIALVFTKTDKLSKNKTQSSIAKFKRALKTSWEELPINFQTSTVSGIGKEDIISYIRTVNKELP
jgi:GTP-binding protein